MKSIYESYIATCKSCGIKPISDDWCCRLLAIVYVYGGNSESFTHNMKLLADVEYAQERLNIKGGCIPDAELLPELQQYIKEIEEGLSESEYIDNKDYVFAKLIKPNWVVSEMKKRYNITIR